MTDSYRFDWADLAFANKRPVKSLKAIFIMAPREISAQRFTQLVKEYLPQGNLVLGLAKEPYVLGFEDQPQFKTLQAKQVAGIIDKVNRSKSAHKIYILDYSQNDTKYVIENLGFKKFIGVNGSWQYAFHTKNIYYTLNAHDIPYQLVSPFCDEAEARSYQKRLAKQLSLDLPTKDLSDEQLLKLAQAAAKLSYDYNFQTGAVLSIKHKNAYKPLAAVHNKVVPFETYAMHNGALREKHLSPTHDLNHYDTIHAEAQLILWAQENRQSLKGTTLHINLLPCPPCARMLSQSGIDEVVYSLDHSDGYAIDLLQKTGKTVRRVVMIG
ncbi:MAG: deaminase [Candidatus Saccharimonadales bacterium]